MQTVVVQDPIVTWLEHYELEGRKAYRSVWNLWYAWLQTQPAWNGKTPLELLEFQEQAKGRDRHVLEDLMEKYVTTHGGTVKSQVVGLARLRSFFLRNHVDLPSSRSFIPRPTKDSVEGKMSLENVKELISHASIRDQAIYLTMFQGLMDLQRFTVFNTSQAERLVKHLKEKKLDEPFKIDFSRRKRNLHRFPTFIYRDALEAWTRYFERIRGWPKPMEPIAVSTQKFQELAKAGIRDAFDTDARQLRLKPSRGSGKDRSFRTGVAPHDCFRDVVKSLLQTATRDGFDMVCADLWMGHTIDPDEYNRFDKQHPEYVLENAKIASKYLNILSGPHELKTVENEELIKLRKDFEQLRGQFESVLQKKLTDAT